MTPDEFRRETSVSRETLARLERYGALLAEWNRAINLVGRGSLDDLWRRHMLDSAQLMPLLPPAPAGRRRLVVDLGSGAGFPGLVLSILGAGAVHLVEADRRKAAFLREAARRTGSDAQVHDRRIEALEPLPADLVTARACAPLTKLLAYAAPFLAAGGAASRGLFLKGRRVDEELTEAAKAWNMAVQSFQSRSDSGGTILRIGLKGHETTIS
jgi:16S rRNA (guanine527-N7)-methyltransferase